MLAYDRYRAELPGQVALHAAALDGADLTRPVPTCPGWTLADLVAHSVGTVHGLDAALRGTPDAPGPERTDLDALAAVSKTLADTLGGLDPAARPGVFGLADWTVHDWARRAVQDLVVHRADAAAALGTGYDVAHDLAADAIDELLEFAGPGYPWAAKLAGVGASVHVHATDTDAEWFVEAGANGLVWRREHAKADVAVRGPLIDVMRVLFRRLPTGAPGVEVLGDTAAFDRYLEAVNWG